ncbi:Transcription termination protein NusB [Chitinispirillum alkaliphilum]|nr:Transcription termination protein NusB [Chitinispirillum alkaliphilum]
MERIADSEELSSEVRKYARELVHKVIQENDAIYDLLTSKAQNWELKRMAIIDRNVLRIAIAELCYFPDVPYKVVIDEAVEIAKTFGTDDSGKFVNGILDSAHRYLSENPPTRK